MINPLPVRSSRSPVEDPLRAALLAVAGVAGVLVDREGVAHVLRVEKGKGFS